VRFAPSPTGFLHIGGLRTALYNYLFARKNKGIFVLRIEDTDQTRSVPGGIEAIIEVLSKVGLKYDEGPYVQSKRLDIYKKYAEDLVKKDKAYYCFCSPERLEEVRQKQIAEGKPTMYDKKCRQLSKKEITEKIKNKTPYVIRLKIPGEGVTAIDDIIRGKVDFENKLIDDQVLLKSDGFPTYHLANVVDDYLMKISHVIRGEEWLPSTPKHILLYKAFRWKPPKFAHLPLLLNPDKSKLSKRQGDIAVEDYLKKGYLPEALLNFVALMGYNPSAEQEVYNLKELIKGFDLDKINKTGAVFNIEKLDWLNGVYIRKKSSDELVELCLPYLKEAGALKGEINKKWLKKVVALEQERLKRLDEIVYLTEFFFKDKLDYESNLLIWKKMILAEVGERLNKLLVFFESIPEKNFTQDALEIKVKDFIRDNNFGTGEILWPLRVALSGREASPGPFEIAEILGKNKTIQRVKDAVNKL
jgi:glutamyl-tRNA synthetase